MPAPDFDAWLDGLEPRWVVALTLWGEARGEDHQGRLMVADVIENRFDRARAYRARKGCAHRWGETPAAICTKAWQFSTWNENDPNRAKLRRVTEATPVFAECLEIADALLSNRLGEDRTGGATHYLNPEVVRAAAGRLPDWATEDARTAIHGHHHFYRAN
jgi:hypothetical protein